MALKVDHEHCKEYRCLVFAEDPAFILATREPSGYGLPRIHIPRHTRPAQQIQSAFQDRWNLHVFLLDFWPASNHEGPWAIARLLGDEPALPFPLQWVGAEAIPIAEFAVEAQSRVQALIAGSLPDPLVRLEWPKQAVTWIESITGERFSVCAPKQWNAGGGFALFRICSEGHRCYWLKATRQPNLHELAVTRLLAAICPEALPGILGARSDWNAWLSEDAGFPPAETPGAKELVLAAQSAAQLQIRTIGHARELLIAGASDQRLSHLALRIDSVIAWLIEAMAHQTSTAVPALSRTRLLALGELLRESCDRLESLAIPDTILHNDLNPGNILSTGTACVLTDWSEAAIGNPFLGCERLCQLNRAHAPAVQAQYTACWSKWIDSRRAREAIRLAPLVAIFAYLYGRGEWLDSCDIRKPDFESYARSLARHMDRAAQELSVQEALCP